MDGTHDPPRARRFGRFPFRVLLALPVVCAPVFLWLASRYRVEPVERWRAEHAWCCEPLGEFRPADGTPVVEGDDLVKVARVNGPDADGRCYGESWWVTPDGTLHNRWSNGVDAGVGRSSLSGEALARLPALIRALPASDPTVGPRYRVYVAFPVRRWWVVRTYDRRALPRAVDDLMTVVRPPFQ